MSTPATPRCDRETALLAGLAVCVSVVSFLFYVRHDAVLLSGDAVAHINIARRVFDSRTPGLLQLGTVWLPLPHLLMIPFLLSDWAWRTGVGGSIPSLAAYVLGVVGIFRLVRGALSFHSQPDTTAKMAAWLAAGIYAANPNLIYLQTTAMTEPVYLALFIWAVVYFAEFAQAAAIPAADSALLKCGLCLAAACLTRYDGWFLSASMCGAAMIIALRTKNHGEVAPRGLRNFVLLAAAAPVFWLAYNAVIYRNPLEFANGPYSARAIEQKSSRPGVPPHPGSHDLVVAGSYFLKSAELNLAEGGWQKLWTLLALAGVVLALFSPWLKESVSQLAVPSLRDSGRSTSASRHFRAGLSPAAATRLGTSLSHHSGQTRVATQTLKAVPTRILLLLWVPLPFYMLSVAYGGVPIFLPVWWPFSFYNTRYGLELLPAFAVFTALAFYFLANLVRSKAGQIVVTAAIVILIFGSYTSIWQVQPVCFREAWINSRTRIALETELAARLKELPPGSSLLMYLGDHVGALQQAGIPLRRVIHEGNHRTWRQPSDPEGLWERALADPAQYADFVVAIDGDAVSTSVRREGLLPVAEILVPGQPRAAIYRTRAAPVITRVNFPTPEALRERVFR